MAVTTETPNELMVVFSNTVTAGFDAISGAVTGVFGLMIALVVALTGIQWALSANREVLAAGFGKILLIGAFAWLINDWQALSETIYDGFIEIGLLAGGSGIGRDEFLNPGSIVEQGWLIVRAIGETPAAVDNPMDIVGNLMDALILAIAMLGIMIAFAVLAIQIIVALLEFKIVTLGGFVLLPFGIWSKSAFLAERPLGYVVSSGLKVLALAIVVSGARSVFDQLVPTENPDIYEALTILVAAMLLAMLAIFIPNLAAALVTGGPALGAGAAMTGGLAVGGAAALAGGAVMKAGSALLGAGRGGGSSRIASSSRAASGAGGGRGSGGASPPAPSFSPRGPGAASGPSNDNGRRTAAPPSDIARPATPSPAGGGTRPATVEASSGKAPKPSAPLVEEANRQRAREDRADRRARRSDGGAALPLFDRASGPSLAADAAPSPAVSAATSGGGSARIATASPAEAAGSDGGGSPSNPRGDRVGPVQGEATKNATPGASRASSASPTEGDTKGMRTKEGNAVAASPPPAVPGRSEASTPAATSGKPSGSTSTPAGAPSAAATRERRSESARRDSGRTARRSAALQAFFVANAGRSLMPSDSVGTVTPDLKRADR